MRAHAVVRLVALVLAVAPAGAAAQHNAGAPAAPYLPGAPASQPAKPAASRWESLILGYKRSPEFTQDRNFTSTRFWLLDPGEFEVESWVDSRVMQKINGSRGASEVLFQQELEIGLCPHVQLDLYENFTANVQGNGHRGVQQEGIQLEARIAIPSYYGQIFGNPVVYLEFHPRHADPDRAEIRLLLGGALSRRWFVAINPYFEANVEKTPGAASDGSAKWILDAEVGTTAALGFAVAPWLRLSAQLKIGGDMLGDPANKLHFVAWAGPGFILRPLPGKKAQYLKIMGTLLVNLVPGWKNPDIAPQMLQPTVIVGSQF